MLRRLAGPMARRPLAVLVIGLLVCAAAATGFLRFAVDSGQSLLVGSRSAAGQADQSFSNAFGTDPMVVVLTARNPTAPYLEKNLQRLTALEEDLAHDPRVASVLGPGTVARSALAATTAEVSKTLVEYPYFVAESSLLQARQNGATDANALKTKFQSDITTAQNLFELYVARAAGDAHLARQAYQQKAIPTNDRLLDGQELAVEAAVAKDPLPPLFAEYLAGPGATPDPTATRQFFDRLTAAFGDCSSSIAQLLSITSSCQVYLARILLDLPSCPTEGQVKAATAKHQELFCTPKPAWAAVLPPPSSVDGALVAREVITVRLTPAAARSRTDVLAVKQKITDELRGGIASDAYTQKFNAGQLDAIKALGPLVPTDCGDVGAQQNQSCYTNFANKPFAGVIAGAPLLAYGVVDSMSETLLILLPVVLVLMAVLLVAVFRVRGRLWPLLAAGAAAAATVGIALWLGLAITPAVLAGIPVLVGLAVDYAVQLVARYDEEARRGASREQAIEEALGRSGPATFTAALATLAGLVALMVIAGVDGGPLVAVPLVAEFALVLAVGVILSWVAAIVVALPAAALGHRSLADSPEQVPAVRRPDRTLAIAGSWRGALVPAVLVALLGWVLLPRVPVQTDIEQLLAPSLPQLQDVNTVRTQTGYGNEIDLLVQGREVVGPYNQAGTPSNVIWQCGVAQSIRTVHADQVALATSIADFFIASSASAATSASAPCAAAPAGAGSGASPGASPSPSVSPSAGASAPASPSTTATPAPSPTLSPSAYHRAAVEAVLAATAVATPSASAAAATATAPASPAPTVAPSTGATAAPSPTPSAGASSVVKTQTAFLCDLRLLPELSRSLVQSLPVDTTPCPAVDKYLNAWLTNDTSPIDPTQARLVIGVAGTAIADEAHLIDSLRTEIANSATPTPNGLTIAPVGLVAMAAQAYDNIVSRSLLLNLLPLAVVFLVLLAVERNLRRAALPILPTAIAAGWAPLIIFVLGLLPGSLGKTLGSFNPLTVVMGALVIALATEFGVVLLRRFDEECARGLGADDAAAATLAVTGRAIRVSALTLGAGFAVLAISALLPGGLPLLGAFGLTVLIDLTLAVLAVFGIMLPLAVAMERSRSPAGRPAATALPAPTSAPTLARPAAVGAVRRSAPRGPTRRPLSAPARPSPAPVVDVTPARPAPLADAAEPTRLVEATPRRRPGVSGRRRPPAAEQAPPGAGSPPAPGNSSASSPATDAADQPQAPRRPGVSGRRRRGPPPPRESG